MDDFTPLTSPDHYLGWLGDDPPQMVRDAIEEILQQQVPTSRLEWVRLLGDAEFLTGGREIPANSGKMLVTRAALAVEFELEVSSNDGTYQLHGIFSWVARGLDGERHDRTFFDLDVEMEWAADMLKARIYDWDVFGKPDSGEPPTPEIAPTNELPQEKDCAPSQAHSKRGWQFWRKKS